MDYLFLRHAETDVTDRLEWHGQADPPLSSKGRAHARAAAERLGVLRHLADKIPFFGRRPDRTVPDLLAVRSGSLPSAG